MEGAMKSKQVVMASLAFKDTITLTTLHPKYAHTGYTLRQPGASASRRHATPQHQCLRDPTLVVYRPPHPRPLLHSPPE